MEQALTNAEVEEMIEAYNLFDKDNSGSICAEELKGVLRALGQNPSEADVESMMAEWADKETGQIEFENYKKLIEKHRITADMIMEQLKDAFQIFDKDGSGALDSKELMESLTHLGEPLTEEEADELIRLADVDGDGCLNIHELVNALCENPSIVGK